MVPLQAICVQAHCPPLQWQVLQPSSAAIESPSVHSPLPPASPPLALPPLLSPAFPPVPSKPPLPVPPAPPSPPSVPPEAVPSEPPLPVSSEPASLGEPPLPSPPVVLPQPRASRRTPTLANEERAKRKWRAIMRWYLALSISGALLHSLPHASALQFRDGCSIRGRLRRPGSGLSRRWRRSARCFRLPLEHDLAKVRTRFRRREVPVRNELGRPGGMKHPSDPRSPSFGEVLRHPWSVGPVIDDRIVSAESARAHVADLRGEQRIALGHEAEVTVPVLVEG